VTLVQSDFTGTAPAQNLPWTATSVLDSSITFSGWSIDPGIDPGIQPEAIDDALGFSIDAGETDSTLAQSLSDRAYFSCLIQSVDATPLDLNGLKVVIDALRISHWSPKQFAIFTSVGGFNEGQEVFITPEVGQQDFSERSFSFFLPHTGYDAIIGDFEIRVVPFNGRYSHPSSITGFSLISGVPTYMLTVNSGNGGSAVSIPAAVAFEQGEQIQLSALPDAGYRFGGWSGDVEGFGNPRTVVMDADKVVTGNFSALPPIGMRVGTNLNSVTDYTSSWVFKDLFKRMRPWMTRNSDQSGSWDSGLSYTIPLDRYGWPTVVPFDPGTAAPTQIVHTILAVSNKPGPHTLFYDGLGVFRFRAEANPWQYITATGSATLPLIIQEGDRVTVELLESGPSPNHLRNFRIVPDEYILSYDTEPFHPQFIDRSKNFDVLRFMDWGRTNNSTFLSWVDRTRADHQTQSRSQGVAIEYLVALANLQHSDAWVCIPHLADDDHVTQMAEFLRDNLDPTLRVYVEYSNETWNSSFGQTGYVQDQGEALALDSNRWQAGHKYVARRSAEIWSLFETVYGEASSTRVVKVLATQSANISVTNSRVAALNDPGVNPNFVFADALAIAPYFGHNYTSAELPPSTSSYPTIDEIVDAISIAEIANVANHVAAQKAAADLQGMSLICYEGGQHFVGIGAAQSDTTLAAILNEANRDPRMYLRYQEYLDMLKAGGIEVFANFILCAQFSTFGSWGTMEFIDDTLDEAVKYSALRDWMAEKINGETLFRITRFHKTGSDLEIDWRSKPAHSYQIETSILLDGWMPGPSGIPSQGLSTSHVLKGAGANAPLFLRVVEE
jgi:hypothetical protein